VSENHIEEVIRQMAELADHQKRFIKDMPDYFRRVRVHLDRVSKIILLVKKSVAKNYWMKDKELFDLIAKAISSIDEDKALVNRKAYDEHTVEVELKEDKNLTKDEEKLTFAFYESLNDSRLDKGPKTRKTLMKIKTRLSFAHKKEGVVDSIDVHLAELLNHFGGIVGLIRDRMRLELDSLRAIESYAGLKYKAQEWARVEQHAIRLRRANRELMNLHIELKEHFHKPFQKFLNDKITAEERVAEIISEKNRGFWNRFSMFRNKVDLPDVLRDYGTMTSPSEVLDFFHALRRNQRFLTKRAKAFIIHAEKGVLRKANNNAFRLARQVVLAHRDRLTGAIARPEFEDRLFPSFILNYTRTGKKFSLLFLDIDNFKKFNDPDQGGYGHSVGDEVLKMVVESMRHAVRFEPSGIIDRKIDPVIRYGGEEFVVLLSASDKSSAIKVANRVRIKIMKDSESLNRKRAKKGKQPWYDPTDKENRKPVTMSIGVATFPDDCGIRTIEQIVGSNVTKLREQMVKAADKALYKAKDKGRNRVEAA